MANLELPIPQSEIESVLAWVDTFKLSRQTKKIHRDFSDAVLLAEILAMFYPKLVEMHNYPPRNSHSLKLNNWLTLNRKVLKKLKLNLCCNTMEQLANCNPGVIERVLVMVRDKIRRDEDMNKSVRDAEQGMSSGGSFYEACGDEDHVLVVPVKTRVNGVLEMLQQKVVNYESYQALKEELKDARDSTDVLKQKVEHLDNLLQLKDQRIDELQKQLDRKQARRKEVEAFQNNLNHSFEPAEEFQNSLQVPFETVPSPVVPNFKENAPLLSLDTKTSTLKPVESKTSKEFLSLDPKTSASKPVEAKTSKELSLDTKTSASKPVEAKTSKELSLDTKTSASKPVEAKTSKELLSPDTRISASKLIEAKTSKDETKIPIKSDSTMRLNVASKPSLTEVPNKDLEQYSESIPNFIKSAKTYEESLDKCAFANVAKPHVTKIIVNYQQDGLDPDVNLIRSDVFKEIEIIEEVAPDYDEFEDSRQDSVTSIEQSIEKEIKNISKPMQFMQDMSIEYRQDPLPMEFTEINRVNY